jgi:hypothetical protein
VYKEVLLASASERPVARARAFAGTTTPLLLPVVTTSRLGATSPVRQDLMTPQAHHRHPSSWRLVLAATLALAPGCSGDPPPQDELVPFWDSRGIMSYHYVPRKPPATEVTAATSSSLQDAWQGQQELVEAEEQRRRDVIAYREMRRELDDRRRVEQQEEDAYREWWWRNRRDRRLRETEERRAYYERLSRWSQEQRLRGEAEAARWRQVTQTIDALLLRSRR